jgi:hypothetical protein
MVCSFEEYRSNVRPGNGITPTDVLYSPTDSYPDIATGVGLVEASNCRRKLFFFKRRQKLCLNLLIKKKRIAQLINEKPGKNRYNKSKRTTPKHATP